MQTRLRAPWVPLATTLLLAALTGCVNLLRPAEPEPPSGTGGGVELNVDYTSPEGVLETLASAFSFRTQPEAVQAYMGAFANPDVDGVPFLVEFDPAVAAGVTVPVWTRTLEQTFYTSVFELDTGDYALLFRNYDGAPDDVDDEPAGRATRYREYELVAIPETGSIRLAIGRVDIDLRKLPTGNWVITRWSDLVHPSYGPDPEEPGNRSFSRLRLVSAGVL